MLTTRTVAAGAATFVVLMLAGEPVRADSVKQTNASAPAEAAIAKVAPAKVRACRRGAGKREAVRAKREAARLKKRASERKRHQRITKSDVPTSERSEVPEAQPGNPSEMRPDPSIAERRFREFINPRLVAENPIEALRKSWPESTQLTGQSSYPLAAMMAPARPQTRDEEREATETGTSAERSVASEEIAPVRRADAAVRSEVTPIDRTTYAVAVAPREQGTELRRTARSDGSSDQFWLPVIFIAWGGVLMLGSALRLLID
jgi:hypothetical protein